MRSDPCTHVALLRGVNVGGKNKLPMKSLVEMFIEAGCTEVRTYIQSGNVVFKAQDAIARRVSLFISAAILDRFGLRVPVVTRTAAEFRTVTDNNPFLQADTDAGALHVAFLADLPGPSKVAELDPKRSPPDEFAVRGREIYLRCPNGVARTKLTNEYFDSKLGTISTMRNWRTVLHLLEETTSARAATREGGRSQTTVRSLIGERGVAQSKMFGFDGLTIGGKFFAVTFKGNLVVKLPHGRVEVLVSEGKGERFNPYGRVKKEWVVLGEPQESWADLAREALRFVRGITASRGARSRGTRSASTPGGSKQYEAGKRTARRRRP